MEPDKSGTIPIRKSLAAMRIKDQKTGKLKSTDERKGYFYCLKLLGVLPPPPNSGFEKWVYYTPAANLPIKKDQQLYTPKCLHDVLIASHATTCEHHNLYFGSYHRHLTVLTGLFLNFAHQVLRGGYEKLQKIYFPQYSLQQHPKQSDKYFTNKFAFLYNEKNKDLWTNVFNIYQKLKGIPDQISNHYWNPTNYLNDQDLKVLEELAPKTKTDDQMDVLFKDINSSYPWEINVPRRWYNTSDKYNLSDIIDNKDFFYKGKVNLTPNQQLFISGNLDPRQKNSAQIYGQDGEFLKSWSQTSYNLVANRNYKSYQASQDKNYSVNSISDDELLSNYGAKSKNLQYITKKEGEHLDDLYIHNYNMLIPHWQYAQALFNSSVNKFYNPYEQRTNDVSSSHDTIHDNFSIMMDNATYSITSLMFFPYHSWIDCGIQLYNRRANNDDNKSYQKHFNSLSSLLTNINPLPGVLHQIISKAENLTKGQIQWKINGVSLNQNRAGAYPICEYISPIVSRIQQYNIVKDKKQKPIKVSDQDLKMLEASFCASDYILTKQNIRDSFHFNDIYQNYYIDKLNRDRFYFLNNIKNYNFDYNYQVEVKKGVWQQLDINATNLPGYLKDMSDIGKRENQVKNQAIKAAAQMSVNPKASKLQVQKRQTGNAFQGQEQGAHERLTLGSRKEQEHEPQVVEVSAEEFQKVRKLFQSGLHLYASYSPETKNGNQLIYLNLSKALQRLHDQQGSKELEGSKGQKSLVGFIRIFGKEGFAEICPKCQKHKARFLDLDENLRVRLPKLWQFIHTEALNKVLYDSKDPDIQIHCVSQNISLVANDTFKDYRLVYGAEEIEVQLVDKTTSNESQYIRLDTESYSMSKNVINSVLSKKFYTFKSKRFDFYKIFDVFNGNENIYFDRYVYKQLKGVVFVGSKKIEFNIPIPCYQRLLRLKLYIIGYQKDLQVVVEDADFYAKKQFYRNAGQK